MVLRVSRREFLGPGRTELVTPAQAQWTRSDDGAANGLWLRLARTDGGEDWSIFAAMPLYVDRWTVGSFPVTGNANRNPVKGYVDLSHGWRGRNAMTGTMAVDSVTFDDAGLARLEARMVVSCDSPPRSAQPCATCGEPRDATSAVVRSRFASIFVLAAAAAVVHRLEGSS